MNSPAALAGLPRSLAARVAALPPRRRERVQDLGLGTAIASASAASLVPYLNQLHPSWLAVTLVAAQGLPLTWRRSWPVAVVIVVGGVRVAYDRIGFSYAPLPLGPLIAFYTVIDRCPPVWRWLTVAGSAAGIAVSEAAAGHRQPYDTIFQVMAFLTVWAAGVLSRATRASMRAAHRRAELAEAEVDRQSAQAAGRERTRIARELHDVVAHHVSLIAVQAEAAASLLPARPAEARRSVDVIGDTARQALTELRRLLGVLRGPSERPETTPSASLAELGDLLDQVRGAGLPVDFLVEGTPCSLPPGVDLTAYRIIQEALTNSLRHSGAARAAVTLGYEPGYITVSITDSGRRNAHDGRTGPLLTGAGLGLAGITERVASCGGSLSVGPAQPDGFAVTARLPAR